MPKQKQLTLFTRLASATKASLDSAMKPNTALQKKTPKRTKGDEAEAKSAAYLQTQGLQLLEKNFTTRAGEVDIIMKDKVADTLVFVEVRYRKNNQYGGAAASVTPKKQQRIIKAALAYQQQHAPQAAMRFDVVAIEGENTEWIKSAFDGF